MPPIDYAQLAADTKQAFARNIGDFSVHIGAMSDICGTWFSDIQGFSQQNFPTDCMLVVTELAEAVEGHRKRAKIPALPSEHIPDFTPEEEEIADVLVRILHMASKYNLRLGPAFEAKMGFNFTRPVKHGKGY